MKKLKDKIYFNHAGLGPISRELYLKLNKFVCDYYNFGPPEIIRKYKIYVNKLKREIAKLLNCDFTEIVYTKNTTEGIFLASELIPLKKNDEILILAEEYGANYIPWLKKKQDGFKVDIIGGGGEEGFNNLLAAINNKTRVISISWVQYRDGYLTDIVYLSKICRDKNIFLVVDAIQVIGTRELNLKKIKIDMLACGGHKHLGSIVGSGFLYVNKNILSKLNHCKIGVRGVETFSHTGYKLRNDSRRFEDGTPNLFGILSLYCSIKQINRIGIKNIGKRNILLLKKYKELLKQNNIPFIDYKKQGNIISLPLPNSERTCKILEKHNIYTKVIKGALRISFNYKNNLAEFKKLIKKMSRL